MFHIDKKPEDILKEDILQEKAAVLRRTSEKVFAALESLRAIEKEIQERFINLQRIADQCRQQNDVKLNALKTQAVKDLNAEISRFNHAREYAKKRYYYLIVTREAMGMRLHQWIEDIYKIPPRKKHLRND